MCDNLLKSVGIIGTGSYVPEKIVTNFDLENMVDTSDEWIVKRTGISQRRILDKDEPSYTMGVKSAERALEDAKIKAEDLDLIICTTITPDFLTPSMSCLIQREIGAVNAAAFDLNAACSGFMYGMTVAKQFIQTGTYKNILVVGCEGLSKVTDWEDRNTCILFADGSGAAILSEVEQGFGILETHLGADGKGWEAITLPGLYLSEEESNKREHENKRVIIMDGHEVFKFAVKTMENAALKVINAAGYTTEDVDLLVPHQANIRITDSASKKLGIPKDKVYINLDKYGNCSSSSCAIALDEAAKNGLIKKGDNVAMVGFGAGLTWASAFMKWCK